MSDLTKWVLGIVSVLICAGIIAAWKLVAGKPSRQDLAKTVEDWTKEVENLKTDLKLLDTRVDTVLVKFAEAITKTDLLERMGSASMRTDDQDRRVQKDILEVKTDLKALIEKVINVDKRLDELPSRVLSLEQTRSEQSRGTK